VSTLVRIPVGVVVERCRAASAWVDFIWRPMSVLPGEPAATAWTALRQDADSTVFYAGPAALDLHASDTSSYRENLATGEPKLWVVLRPTGREPPFDVVCVTADGSEGEGFTAAGEDIVDCVPMPPPIVEKVAAFVDEHHVDRPFHKRQRDRAILEAFGRRPALGTDEE